MIKINAVIYWYTMSNKYKITFKKAPKYMNLALFYTIQLTFLKQLV